MDGCDREWCQIRLCKLLFLRGKIGRRGPLWSQLAILKSDGFQCRRVIPLPTGDAMVTPRNRKRRSTSLRCGSA